MVGVFRRDSYNKKESEEKSLVKKKSVISPILFFALTLMYTVAYNSSWRAISLLWYGISLVTIALLLIVFIQKNRFRLNFYTGWIIIFLTYFLFSSLWAININPIFEQLKTLILVFAVNVLLVQVIDTKQDLEKILKANFIALFLLLIYIIINTDISVLGSLRIGVDTLGKYWNANDIGIKLSIGFAICLYFMLKNQNIKWRVVWGIFSLLFMGVSLFTGSRKVVILLAGIIFLVFWLRAKKHRMAMFIVMCLVVSFFVFLTLKIPVLYNVLGVRLESLIKEFFGISAGEASYDIRKEMIELGLRWFEERPIFGYGLNNFRELYFLETGIDTYSHSNFIEILVGGGVIGFAIYYSLYMYIIFKLLKPAFKQRNTLIITIFALNFMFLFLQMALVFYYEMISNCLLLLGAICVRIGDNKNEF